MNYVVLLGSKRQVYLHVEGHKQFMNFLIHPILLADAAFCSPMPLKLTDCTNSLPPIYALGDTTAFQFSAEIYKRDGFGPSPAFAGIVAETGQQLLGYLLYTFEDDTDRATRYLTVIDLLVDADAREQGLGRALMNAASDICQQRGGQELFWAVYHRNTPAIEFYSRLGAHPTQDLVFMTLLT